MCAILHVDSDAITVYTLSVCQIYDLGILETNELRKQFTHHSQYAFIELTTEILHSFVPLWLCLIYAYVLFFQVTSEFTFVEMNAYQMRILSALNSLSSYISFVMHFSKLKYFLGNLTKYPGLIYQF